MKKNLFIILFLISGSIAYSQPGYQGHKFLILYDFNLSPALLNYNAQGETGFTSFNLIHQAKFEYAWRRKFNLGVQGSFDKTSLDISDYNSDERPIKSNNIGFGIYAKRFASDDANLAPRGSYFQFGIGAQYVNIYDERTKDAVHSYIGNFSVNCGFGKQTILYKRLMIDYGVTFSLNNSVFNVIPIFEFFTESDRLDAPYSGTGNLDIKEINDTYKVERTATYTSLASNLVAVKIGIGLLP